MRYESEYCRENPETAQRVWEPFNEAHAIERHGLVWHEGKGLRREDALELVNKWNRMSLAYRYFLRP